MKWYDLAHAALTLTLLCIVVVFAVLLVTGLLELRRPSRHAPAGEPIARLIVLHGLRPGWEYRLFEGENFIGRADQQPVEIDLQPQEPGDRVWSARQHAVISRYSPHSTEFACSGNHGAKLPAPCGGSGRVKIQPDDCCILNSGGGAWAFAALARQLSATLWLDVSETPRRYNYRLACDDLDPATAGEFFIPLRGILSGPRRLGNRLPSL